jgi:hypothetical protein
VTRQALTAPGARDTSATVTRRVQRQRIARTAGAVLAALLAPQPAIALYAAPGASSCCCHHRDDQRCSCPMCAHRREVSSSSVPLLKSCGTTSPSAVVGSLDVFVAPVCGSPIPAERPAEPRGPEPCAPAPPALDVPTPPPLG